MESLNEIDVIVKNCPDISSIEALQWFRALKTNVLNFEEPKIILITMDNKINLEIMQRVNALQPKVSP
jgi:hypothetical protein